MDAARLFRASCIALVATSMSFAIRGDVMGDFETVFSLTATEVGWISGAAFWGFGISILFGGPLCDVLGMRTLARLAAVGHIAGTLPVDDRSRVSSIAIGRVSVLPGKRSSTLRKRRSSLYELLLFSLG